MAYYAFTNENNIVTSVISGVDEDIYQNDNGVTVGGSSQNWEIWYGNFKNKICKRTSYNTRGGIHYQADNNTPSLDQSKAFRKNYAGIGYYYDSIRDAFIPPKPYPSWILDEFSCLWQSPISYPDTSNIPEPYIWYNRYFWNEDNINWELMKPFDSWLLNQDNYYVSPTPYPNDVNKYYWNEDILNWELII
jgi:hypothetical protein